MLSTTENGYHQWFEDGTCNISYMMLDYHVANGKGNKTALIFDSPVTNTKKKYTYSELLKEVAEFAGVLKSKNVAKGDTVIIYMPMIPEAVIAMIACARIGAIHSVVFGGFAAHELAIRIDDAKPKVLITASYGMEFDKIIPYLPLVEEAYHLSFHQPESTILVKRPHHTDVASIAFEEYHKLTVHARASSYVEMKSIDPLYIIYTSGTTGKPKGIVRDTGAYALALHYSLEKIYNIKEEDIFWAASDVGWVVGHSYICYAPLLMGCTTVVYEGKPIRTPDAGSFWRMIEEYKINLVFAAPTAFRAIKKEDAEAKELLQYDISSLKSVFVAGERCDPATYEWIFDKTEVPVIDHWWQTESGWPMIANMLGIEQLPIKPGSSSKAVCGYNIKVLNEAGEELPKNTEGFIAIKLPLPPGCLTTLWNEHERFKESYLDVLPGYYFTGDGGYIDEDDYVYIMGRVDDVINVSGHRLSTGEMEEMIAAHPDIAECAVVGIADELRGQRPLGFFILKDGHPRDEKEVEEELVKHIRNQIGAVAYFKNAIKVNRLPKTRSGKILRKTIRQIADGEEYVIPSTIDDPSILDEIAEAINSKF
jgi:acyl-coenzyme A synthetase/AMP-(fatty) acid ligase